MIRPSQFRKGAFALTTAGVLAASTLLSFSAAAETTKPASAPNGGVTSTTDCSKYRPDMVIGDTLCAYYKDKVATEQGKALKAEGRALDRDTRIIRQETEAINEDTKAKLRVNMCLSRLLSFKKDQPDVFATFGKITSQNACEIAARLPQKSAASVPPQKSATLN